MHQHAIGSTKDIHTATRVKAPPNTTPIVLPQSVFALFVSYAAENTRRDIEFIGILCGKKIPDVTNPSKLVIACTHLLIPPQHGTKDTCYCDDEELLSDYIIDYNSNLSFEDTSGLIIIGWIHTHPTQKAFLSSVDLHTHMPFQLVFSESIAVVVAVRENDIAIFSMSEDGVQKVKNCQLKGFHPHQENVKVSPIYGIASHVLLVDEAKGVKLCGGQPVPVDLKRWKAAKK